MRIRPRCFVVMPYGKKPVGKHKGKGRPIEIDFDLVYQRLLVPALRQAGCSWFRSSEESTSADIRTGMFYELATADFVLADISTLNSNVFYELGVRHGLSSRGSILVHGGWTGQPFDIAVDKSFRYNGKLFAPAKLDEKKLRREVKRLAALIAAAVRADPRHVSSPVYKELRNLSPPDASAIDIPRVGYAENWYSQWRQKVDTAQRKGAACDIMTLAGDAANSLQAADVLYTAAWALIGLQRFEFAEELLRAAVQADPMHAEAQCQLGLVLNRLGRPNEAAEYLNRVKSTHYESKNWLGALGRVNKDMWRDSWKGLESTRERQEACLKNQARAYEALDLYLERLSRNRDSHYAAINVCAITTWLRYAAEKCDQSLDREDLGGLLEESKAVVLREGKKDRKDSGDKGYWACTSLAELALCEGDLDLAEREYERAAHWPGRGKFDIQSMLSHLRVYEELGLYAETTSKLIGVLEDISRELSASKVYDKVVLCLGQMTDDLGNPGCVADGELEPLKQAIKEQLDAWGVGEEHLAICRGVRGAETLFAEACLGRGATVRLLIPLPEDEFIETCVHTPRSDWQTRFTRLIANPKAEDPKVEDPKVEVKFQDVELGTAPPTSSAMRRGLLWCLNTARVAARETSSLHLLLVRPHDRTGSPSGFHAALDELVRLPAVRTEIDPGKLDRDAAGSAP